MDYYKIKVFISDCQGRKCGYNIRARISYLVHALSGLLSLPTESEGLEDFPALVEPSRNVEASFPFSALQM